MPAGHSLTCLAVILLFTKNAITSITGARLGINEAIASAKLQPIRNSLRKALLQGLCMHREPVGIVREDLTDTAYSSSLSKGPSPGHLPTENQAKGQQTQLGFISTMSVLAVNLNISSRFNTVISKRICLHFCFSLWKKCQANIHYGNGHYFYKA